MWDPTAKRDPVTVPLLTSAERDEDDQPIPGTERASATYSRWGARERIAYEDAVTTQFMDDDVHGEDTLRLGTMRLIHATLTIQNTAGFPAVIEVNSTDDKGNPIREVVRFDPKDRRCLVELDGDVYSELVKHALAVYPMPSLGDDDDADTSPSPGEDTGEDTDDLPGPDDEDPSPTPPTPPVDATASEVAAGDRKAVSRPSRRRTPATSR